jgi:hypothetical protein
MQAITPFVLTFNGRSLYVDCQVIPNGRSLHLCVCPRHLNPASRRASMKLAHSKSKYEECAQSSIIYYYLNSMYILFRFVVDIYVGFTSASSNLSAPSYNSPWSTRECTDLLCTFHTFCHYTPVLPNILLAEEFGQCPLASSRQDIVVHRAGVRPLARQNILPLTGSDDSEQFHCVVRKCHQSAGHDGTCYKG